MLVERGEGGVLVRLLIMVFFWGFGHGIGSFFRGVEGGETG